MSVLEQLVQVTVLWPRMLWLLAPLPILVWAYIRLGARKPGCGPLLKIIGCGAI